jgi:hypothetical protein
MVLSLWLSPIRDYHLLLYVWHGTICKKFVSFLCWYLVVTFSRSHAVISGQGDLSCWFVLCWPSLAHIVGGSTYNFLIILSMHVSLLWKTNILCDSCLSLVLILHDVLGNVLFWWSRCIFKWWVVNIIITPPQKTRLGSPINRLNQFLLS